MHGTYRKHNTTTTDQDIYFSPFKNLANTKLCPQVYLTNKRKQLSSHIEVIHV